MKGRRNYNEWEWKEEGIRMNENERKKELEWMRMKELMN